MASGFIPAGLTSEELERALAMAQGRGADPLQDASLPEAPDQPAPPPPVDATAPTNPAPSAPAAEPATEDVPALEAEAPSVAPVERVKGRPSQAIDAYRDEKLSTENDRLENIPNIGDERGLTKDTYDKMAEINQRSAERNKTNAAQARADSEATRAHSNEMRARAERLYSEMEANRQPPPENTTRKVLGIVGGILGMASKNPNVAHGVSMLTGMVGSDVDRWAQERAANSQLYQMALAGAAGDDASELNHLDAAAKMSALEALEIEDSIKAVQNMGLGERANAFAKDLQLQFRGKMLDELTGIEVEKQKKLDAQQAAAAKNAAENRWWKYNIQELEAFKNAGKLDKAGHMVLDQMIKHEGNAADALKKQNEATGQGGEQTGVGGEAAIPGLRLDKPVGSVTAKDYEQAKEITDSFTTMRRALDNMAKSQGQASVQAKKDYDTQFAFAVGALNTLANAGVLNPGELAAWKERLPKHMYDNVTSPTAWVVDEQEQLGTLRDSFRDLAAEKLRSRGYSFDTGPRQGGGQAQSKASGGDDFSDLGFKAKGPAPAPAQSPIGPAPVSEEDEARRLAQRYLQERGPGGGI